MLFTFRLQGTSPAKLFSATRCSPSLVRLGTHSPVPELLPCLTGLSPAFSPVTALRSPAHHFGCPLPFLYPCAEAAATVATLPDVFSMISSPNWRAFRLSALICFSFIWASYCS